MRAIMLMYDTLRWDMLPSSGGTLANLPNFKRLAERSVIFDCSYAGSLPCMPARRELQTGRLNFLHRSWGPMEPFDVSMPELLKQNGVYSYLATDHYHYLEDGGATYHHRFSAWECMRGQECDRWVGKIDRVTETTPHQMSVEKLPPALKKMRVAGGLQNDANRTRYTEEDQFPQTLTVDAGLNFVHENADQDNWFLQLELFDPHEPFTSPNSYLSRYFDPDHPFVPDWPPYAKVSETEDEVEQMRKKYLALLEYCDASLGRVLDTMDELDLWKDTMLIVNTDHGFMLGEHEWWGKNTCPDYQEVVHTPLFIYDPRCPEAVGQHRKALVQTIDLVPTLLNYFGVPVPAEVDGKDLGETIRSDAPVRQYGLFGYFGSAINITDGRYVLMQPVVHPEIAVNEYTLMPTHMNNRFQPEEFRDVSLAEPFPFTRNCKTLKIPTAVYNAEKISEPTLYDVIADPHEAHPIHDPELIRTLQAEMVRLLKENDAPEELYARMGLEG